MPEVFYTTPAERAVIVADQESQGLTMLHDDFNVGPNGANRLTFEVFVAPPPTQQELDRQARRDRIRQLRDQALLTELEQTELLDLLVEELGI